MICYLPQIYPDELLYSWFCRYYVHSGYPSYIMAIDDLLTRRTAKINYEFAAELNDEAKDVIRQVVDSATLILNHTMFPYYARFAAHDRRKAAMDALTNGNANISNLLPFPTCKGERYLMYCPACAAEDRISYGEAYYHRMHQIRHIGICTRHRCRLLSTGIKIHGNASPRLFVAEEVIPQGVVHKSVSDAVVEQFAQYEVDVFSQPLNMSGTVPIGVFLTEKLRGTPYISTVGCMRHIAKLNKDLGKAFEHYTYQEHHLQKVFLGYNFDPHLIALIGYHLSITPQELGSLILDQDSNAVQPHPRTRARNSYCTRAGAQAQNWSKMDKDCLHAVREVIKRLYVDSTGRPRRVTPRAVCDIMGWPNKRLDLLPLCSAEVQRYRETMPQYWAREVVWAYNQLAITNKHINWKAIRDLINIRRKDLHACTPYLIQHTDAANVEIIKKL